MVQMKVLLLRSKLLPATVVISCLLGTMARCGHAEDGPPSKALPENGPATRVFRLVNVPASDVAPALEEFLRSQNEVRSKVAPQTETIVVPDKVRNLVVVVGSTEVMEAVDGLIAELDRRPAMVKAACELIEIGPDGKRHVISRPQVMTLDGQAAAITVGELVPVVESGLEASHVEAGYSISLKVHLSENDTARLEATMSKQEVDKSGGGGVRLVKHSVQIIETIRLGDPVKLVIDKADDGKARSWLQVTVTEVRPPTSDGKKPLKPDAVSRGKPRIQEVRNERVDPGVLR